MTANTINHNTSHKAKIDSLLEQPEYTVDVCVLFILLWVAGCDGELGEEECSFIHEKLPVNTSAIDVEMLEEIIASGEQSSFERIFALAQDLSEQEKNFLLELAVRLATSDNILNPAEHHALEFLADLVGGGALKLKVLHNIVTGEELPPLGDPSSMAWWNAREGIGEEQQEQASAKASGKILDQNEAFQLLGLEKGASQEAIKKAYKSRIQSYHPDRFETKGAAAKRAAQQAFLRIRQAYEVLKK